MNLYFIACAVFALATVALIVGQHFYTALPFAGASAALYFFAMSKSAEKAEQAKLRESEKNARR
ncbi:MAG: hypothetical protein AB7U34_01305 [Novosphingobium sp.]